MNNDNITSLSGHPDDSCVPKNAPNNSSTARPAKGKAGVSSSTSQLQPAVPPAASPQVAETLMPMVSDQPDRDPQERTLTEAAGPVYLYCSTQQTLPAKCEIDGFWKYRARFLEGCGNPQDPVEVLLIESLMLAFHNIGRLLVLSAAAGDSETIVAYTAVAAQLMAELRRGALALQDFQAKARDAQRAKSEADGRKNGKANNLRPNSRVPQEKGRNGKVGSNGHGDPQWIQKRFELPIPVALPPGEAIGCGGRD